MVTSEQKTQRNTFEMLNKLFLKKDEWSKLSLMAVLMDMPNVYSGGRLIQRWLDAKTEIGYLEKDGNIYKRVVQ